MTHLNLGNHQPTRNGLIPTVCSVLLVLLMFIFLTTPVLAVSYVDVINGSPNDFLLNGEKGMLETGLRLRNGDTIEVKQNSGSSVDLILNRGKVTVTSSGNNNPCQIGGDCTNIPKPKGFSGWFFARLGQLFGYEDNIKAALVRKIPECKSDKTSPPFNMPLLAKENNVKLLEGKRQLHFGWHGGYSPYAVSMERQENGSWTTVSSPRTVSFHKKNNENGCPSHEIILKEVKMDVHNFKKGESYQITVTSGKEEVKGYFTVVSQAEDFYPKMRKKVKATAPFYQAALWLAEQDNGEWKLEAYQKVSKDVDNTHSGQLVRLGLADGVQ